MPSLHSELNAANRRFTFTGGGLADGTFSVVEMTGFEALSKPFNFELVLVSKKVDVDFDAMLSISNPATLTICTPDGTPDGKNKTPYHGVLSEFEQLQEVDTLVFYKAVLVPRLQRLSLYRTSDVFLDVKKIPDVLETVIKASGLDSSDYVPIVPMTTGSYRPRTFVCQYQETNFDFISRWMEKEGMYYYFDHSGAKDKLVIVDDVIKLPADISNVIYRPVEDATSSNASDSVHGFVCRQQPLPKKVMLQGFNYAAATVLLEHSYDYDVSPTGTGEVMLYGENFLTPEEGSRYAKLRAEQILCNGKVFKGEATATGIRSGHFIQMSGHYREDFNVKYLVTEIEHSGSQAGVLLAGIAHSFGGKSGETSYRHSFRAIPRFRQLNMQSVDMQFRPECKTKRPYVAGTISAIIDAEGSGQYAELDEFGQYKVQLPFSKSGKAANKGSARIRMATPYAGSDHGMHFPLHKGAEVLLSFMDGDPDQPVILGAVPNSENVSLVNNTNPAKSRIRTKSGNQITMDDTEGKESIELRSADGDTKITVKNAEGPDYALSAIWQGTAGGSESVTSGMSNAIKVGYNNSLNLSFDNSFSASMANKMSIGASTSIGMGHDVSWSLGKNFKIDDAESVMLKGTAKLLANDEITIGGGQVKLITDTIKSTKSIVKKALALNMAVNGAMAIGAGAALHSSAKNGKAGANDPSDGHLTARGLGIGGGLASAVLVHGLLYKMGKMVVLTDNEATYRSKIDVNSKGVDISATNAAKDSTGRINSQSGSLTLWAGSELPLLPPAPAKLLLGSEIKVDKSSINLTAGKGMSVKKTTLEMSYSAAKLETGLGGTIELKNSDANSLRIESQKIVAMSGTSKLTVQPEGIGLNASPVDGIAVKPGSVLVKSGACQVGLKPEGIQITAGAFIKIKAAIYTINSQIIKLG